jgi:hypothetical protein
VVGDVDDPFDLGDRVEDGTSMPWLEVTAAIRSWRSRSGGGSGVVGHGDQFGVPAVGCDGRTT